MKILVACEESQRVALAFRDKGHDAYSCDIIDCSGGHPEYHIKDDVLRHLKGWDMIIAFPPCTYLTVTGNRWFNIERYGEKAIERIKNREKAIEFFLKIANAPCDKIAIENPIGVMSRYYKKPDQIIHPWMFSENDKTEKATCLWLKGLNKLTPIINEKPDIKYHEWVTPSGKHKRQSEWYYTTRCLPHKERANIASKTFQGIAQAMADQWG